MTNLRDSEKLNLYLENIYIYKEDIYRIIWNVVRDDFVADDLTQTVLMNSWRSFHTLKDLKKSKQWIKSITRNVIRAYLKKKPNYITLEEQDLVNDIEKHEHLHMIEKDILEAITEKEEGAMIGQALRSLDPVYQTIIRYHVIADVPLKEISRRLDMKYGTVRVMYSRGMRMLQAAYHKLEKGGELDG